MLALATQHILQLKQLGVKSAFLQAKIEDKVFIEQPKRFPKTSDDGTKLLCKLNKSIYGLKQVIKNSYDRLKTFLPDESFQQNKNDYCVYVKQEDSILIHVQAWVDDIIVASTDVEQIKSVREKFEQNFKMEEKGELRWFLGTRV